MSNVVNQFMQQSLQFPDNIAIAYGDTVYTYQQLDEESDRICTLLQQAHIGPGDCVPLIAQRTPEFVIGILAIAKTGAAYVPIDVHYPERRIIQMTQQSGSSLLLLGNRAFSSLAAATGLRVITLDQRPNAHAPSALPPSLPASQDTAYVIFTSGTTGTPKGVMVSHNALHNLINWHNAHFGMDASCRSTLMAGISFDVAQWEIWSPLICGATLVLPDNEETRLYPDVLLRFFANRHLTHAFVPTVLVHDLVSQPQPDGLTLRYLFTAGEKLNPVNLSRLNCPLFDYYGPTEATIFTTGNTVICSSQNPQPSIGLPVAGAEVYILDEQLQRVTDGEEGELFIGGPGLALGYLNDPALTRGKFFAAPFAPDTRLYRSGDRARRLPDGRIQYLGRLDDQIKIRGNRVELGEIASVLTQVEGVKGAIALLLPATLTREQRILAFVAAESQTPDDLLATLRAHLLETLPTYFMPAAIRIVPRLPLTSNGKVDKAALLTHYLSTPDVASPAQEAPLNEREALLADIWHKALDGATPAFNEHFLDLGGHSLIAARMAVTITERMGVRTYVRDIYDYPTIRLLANALEIRSQSAPLRSDSEPLRILQDDVFLPDDLIIDPHYDERQLTAPRRILLTGATGFVGSQLLADLLRDTDAEVYCLIRADSTEAAAQRLLATLAGFCITLSDEQNKRAIPLVGDISKAQLGLAPDDYTRLCQDVDVIYHSAGAVNYIQPYSFMKHHTVHGIREIVSFAAHSRTKPLILLSSIAIYSWKPLNSDRWMVYEDDDIDLNLPEVITDIGYVRSKWVMEKIANLAAERGLPLMVFRLGYATTHSQTGVSADYQWWGNMVRICVKTGIIPTLQEFREGFTTVDYISNAIVHIGRQPKAIGQRFNLVPEPANNLSHSDFFHLLEKHFGFRFQRQPLHEWLAHWEDDPHSPLYPLLSLFKDNMTDGQSTVELYEDTYQWDNRNLRRFLQGSDIQEPRFTRELLANYLRRTIGYSDIAPAVSPPRRQ